VARRGKESGLVAVGGVGLLAGAFELRVDPQKGRSALLHPALEGGVGALQRRLRLDPRGHVREADDQPVIGQSRRVEFESLSLFSNTLRDGRGGARQHFDAFGGERRRLAVAQIAAPAEVQRDVIERCSRGDQPRRQVEQLAVAEIGGDKVHLGVEHGQSLGHEVDGAAQAGLGGGGGGHHRRPVAILERRWWNYPLERHRPQVDTKSDHCFSPRHA
jgi:hypothetical protein